MKHVNVKDNVLHHQRWRYVACCFFLSANQIVYQVIFFSCVFCSFALHSIMLISDVALFCCQSR